MTKKDQIETLFAPAQIKFIKDSTAKFNIAHGAVRSGKTVCSIFRFLQAVSNSESGSHIWILGHTASTIKRNIVDLILNKNNKQLGLFADYVKYFPGKNELHVCNRVISCLGCKDEGAASPLQGGTCDIMYCDEMTLYPDTVLQMIMTRLSRPGSILFASMNPSHPHHLCKKLINLAEKGDNKYYSQHFSIKDNIFLEEDFIQSLQQTLSGLFYRRYYLGEWCLAEGAIFDFFDVSYHTTYEAPRAADFYIAGLDFGTTNPFACVLLGFNSGLALQEGPHLWVEKEYYWDPKETHAQKTVSEFADDMEEFFEGYYPRTVYIDPSASPIKLELKKRNIHIVDGMNDVHAGICAVTNLLKKGSLTINKNCKNLIREMQSYCWDPKKTDAGKDLPLKKDDHCFAADTKISTRSGLKSISSILEEDEVWTPLGWKCVLKTFHREAELFETNILGKIIQCTSSHKFFTARGWIDLCDLLPSDMFLVHTKEIWKKNTSIPSFKKSAITGTHHLKIHQIENIIEHIKAMLLQEAHISIEMSGNIIKETFQKDIISITSTEIPSTMTLAISNLYWLLKTFPKIKCILQKIKKDVEKKISIKSDISQKNGIDQKKEENGIQNTHIDLSPQLLELFTLKNVNCVSSNSMEENQLNDFVQITVNLDGGENIKLTMSLENVLSAMVNSDVIDMPKQNSVLESVWTSIGVKPVYNLMINECHTYFVEGILTENCTDALRYGCVSFMKGKTSLYTPVESPIPKETNLGWTPNLYF